MKTNERDFKPLVVVVLYQKKLEEIAYLKELTNVEVLIYDNSEIRINYEVDYHYVHDNNNSGVSKAYNYGFILAEQLGLRYVLLLDQDTAFDNSKLEKYRELVWKFGDEYIYAPIIKSSNKIYSPYREGLIRNYPLDLREFNYKELYKLKSRSVINSGLLIPLKVFKSVGLFNEQIKLDFSDTFFINNYKSKQMCLVLIDIQLDHKLSGDEGKNIQKELRRFRFYCNGAKSMLKTSNSTIRIYSLVFFRMLRLVFKYNSIHPFKTYLYYFFGDKRV